VYTVYNMCMLCNLDSFDNLANNLCLEDYTDQLCLSV
jgi:hypothetical protein